MVQKEAWSVLQNRGRIAESENFNAHAPIAYSQMSSTTAEEYIIPSLD